MGFGVFDPNAGNGAAAAGSSHIRFSGSCNVAQDTWRTWDIADGWGTDVLWAQTAGSSGTGAVTVDPANINRYSNGLYFPAAATLEEVIVYTGPDTAHAAYNIYFDLWKIAVADNDTVDGATTRMFRTNWSMDGTTNKIYIKTPTLDTGVINAGDMLVLFFTTPDANGNGEQTRSNFTLKYKVA